MEAKFHFLALKRLRWFREHVTTRCEILLDGTKTRKSIKFYVFCKQVERKKVEHIRVSQMILQTEATIRVECFDFWFDITPCVDLSAIYQILLFMPHLLMQLQFDDKVDLR